MTKEKSESKKNYANVHPVENNKLSVKEVVIKGHTDLYKKYKTKAKNIWGGMKIAASKINEQGNLRPQKEVKFTSARVDYDEKIGYYKSLVNKLKKEKGIE